MPPPDPTGPDLDYPAEWGYRIVGTSEEAIRAHVAEIVGAVEHELVLGNQSSGGAYVSLRLTLVVQDAAQRQQIYEDIQKHEAVRFVV